MLIVYFWVVAPSCAVTTMLILLIPTANAIGPEAVLFATAIPFTVAVAVASKTPVVTVTELVLLGTFDVYASVLKAKAGDNAAVFTDMLAKYALADGARVTVTV